MGEKRICDKCGIEKQIDEFPKRYYGGNQYPKRTCKTCFYDKINRKRRTPVSRDKVKIQKREYMRKLRAERPEHYKYLCSEGKRRLRRQAVEALGSKCVYCGCDVFEAMEINHTNGQGRQEWLKIGSSPMHKMIRDGTYPYPIELTCRVCNAVHYMKLKGIEGYTVTFERTPV